MLLVLQQKCRSFRGCVDGGLACFLQLSRFLDTAGGTLNYRRYAEVLFDILFAGGMLGESLRGGAFISANVRTWYVYELELDYSSLARNQC